MTDLVFIIDRSGSMAGLEQDTVGGFNALLKKQRRLGGGALVSTVLFDSSVEILHDRVPIGRVKDLRQDDYCPGGSTALLDAVGGAIRHIGRVHKYARPEDRPERTLFVITTDGMENASRRYGYSEVRDMIRRQQQRYGWEFLFLGANIDAAAEAGRFGIAPDRAAKYCCDSQGTALNYEVISEAVTRVRSARALDSDWKAPIEQDYRKRG